MHRKFPKKRASVGACASAILVLPTLVSCGCKHSPPARASEEPSEVAAPAREALRSLKNSVRAATKSRRHCAKIAQDVRAYAHRLVDVGIAMQVPPGWQGVTGVDGPGARLVPTAAIGLEAVVQDEMTIESREVVYRVWENKAQLDRTVYPNQPPRAMNLAFDRRLPWSIVVESLAAQPSDEVYLTFPADSNLNPPQPSGESWPLFRAAAFYLVLDEGACRADPPFDTHSPDAKEQRANVDAVLTAYQSEACNCRPNPHAMKEGFWHLYHGEGMATSTRRMRLAKPGDAGAVPFSASGATTFEVVAPKLLELAEGGQRIAVSVREGH